LYAVDAATGTARWEFATQGWLWDGPALYDDTLYLGDLSGNLYALGLDGREIWRLSSGTELTPNNAENKNALEGMIRAQPLVTEDRIYLPTGMASCTPWSGLRENTFDFHGPARRRAILTTPVLAGETLLVAPTPTGASPIRLYAITRCRATSSGSSHRAKNSDRPKTEDARGLNYGLSHLAAGQLALNFLQRAGQ
jgi:hypothetical protein